MTVINSYEPLDLSAIGLVVQEALKVPYDLNSSIPVPTILENKRVALVPFVPSIHAETFFEEFHKSSSVLSAYLPVKMGDTLNEFIVLVEIGFRRQQESNLFAIIDKTKPPITNNNTNQPHGRIAGIIGWVHGSLRNLALEIGPVIILPEFQGTFVSANSIGLLLKYALDFPSRGGLGFRRVAWGADPHNEKSIAAAEKMGFKKEGTLRWLWVMPEGREGKKLSTERETVKGSVKADGRDSILLSICWDDWDGGVREFVEEKMTRK